MTIKVSLDGVFDGIDETFDIENVENSKAVTIQHENKPMITTTDDNVIRETDFVAHEIKGLIESSKSVLDKLDADIKIGSKPRMYEVYSQLTNSITGQLKELRRLHESVAKVKLDQGKIKLSDVGSGSSNISLTSDQLIDLVITAKKDSEINAIDADFSIDDEDMLPTTDE